MSTALREARFLTKRWTHVADLGDPVDCEWFRSLDWGYINPGCVLWWACLPDGLYYIRHLLKYDHTSIPRLCTRVLEMTDDWGIHARSVRYTVADPAIWGQYGGEAQGEGHQGEKMDETFANNGLSLVKADNDRKPGWQRVREMFEFRDDGRPTIIVHPSCRYLIRSLAEAVSSKTDPEDIDFEDDHGLDALRYGAMSRPAPTRRHRHYSRRSFKGQQEIINKMRRHANVR